VAETPERMCPRPRTLPPANVLSQKMVVLITPATRYGSANQGKLKPVVELRRVNLTKSDIDRIPADERFFYIVAGHLANEVSILHKLLIIGGNSLDREGPPGEAAHVQQFLLIKLLAGRLHEANDLISQHYYGKKLHQKYETDLSERAADALRNWRKYFGGTSNVITRIRNKFAFHIDRKEIETTYNQLDDDFALLYYNSPQWTAHDLFLGSEMIFLNSMSMVVDAPTTTGRISKIYLDTTAMSVRLAEFVTGFIELMTHKYIGLKPNQEGNLTIQGDLSISRYTVPFFATPPDAPPIS
jgi:hypothetical protein